VLCIFNNDLEGSVRYPGKINWRSLWPVIFDFEGSESGRHAGSARFV